MDTYCTLKERFDSIEFERAYHTEAPLGAFRSGEQTYFALWAPTAQRVALYLYDHGHWGDPFAREEMTLGAHGVWSYACPHDLKGIYYDFDVTVDGQTRRTADPYARACGANGWRSMVVDLQGTNPPGWERDHAPARKHENIIYEIHVKDFSWDASVGIPDAHRGKFKALTYTDTRINGRGRRKTGVAHLKELGVTHVQLMPVYDYGSVDEGGDPAQFNWGYDPVNYNVPEGSYATDPWRGEVRIREMKEAVQALHSAGLRVIMDVVYNHTYHLDSWLFRSAPWYHYRQTQEGWAGNGSGCGSEIATERSMCARYILDSVLYWAEEYHIDGFRFDLMGLIDVPLMNRIRAELDSRYGAGEKLILGEPWSGGWTNARAGTVLAHKGNLRSLHPGIAAFCDNTRDMVKGSVMDAKHAGFVNGGRLDAAALAGCVRGWAGEGQPFAAPSQTVTYLSAHDDWTLWDKLTLTMTDGRRFAQTPEKLLRANRLAAAICFCCQGHLFMLSGEEFARTKLGVKNSYRTSLRINRLDWKRAAKNRELVRYYQGLIALRQKLPALYDKSAEAGGRILEARDLAENAAWILLDNRAEGSAYARLLLIFNAGKAACPVGLPEGEWETLADGEDSFLHERPARLWGEAQIAPVSCLILGKRTAD